jgi:anti-anti-sigma factor
LQDFFVSAPDLASAQQRVKARLQEQTRPAAVNGAADRLIWQGDITAANADRVWARTRSHITAARAGKLVIDLEGVRFIDSRGASIMAHAKKLAQRERVNLSFTNGPPAVRNVLRYARLEALLPRVPETKPSALGNPANLVLSQQT